MLKRTTVLGVFFLGCTTVPTAPIYHDDAAPDVRAPTDVVIQMDAGNPMEEQPPPPPPPPDVVSPVDTGSPPPDVVSPVDTGSPPPPPPPLPTGGCLRLSSYNVFNSAMSPVTVSVRRFASGGVSNFQTVSFRLADGRYMFLRQVVGAVAGTTAAPTAELGVAPNDNYGTCHHCVVIYFNCSTQPDGTYGCANTAMARTGVMNLTSFATDASRFFTSTLFNVVFQQVSIDPTTRLSTFVRDGACFTLDELGVNAAPVLYSEPPPDGGTTRPDVGTAPPDVGATPPDAGTATPDSGTGATRSEGASEGLRATGGASSGPLDRISYHECTAAAVACGTGTSPVCRLQPGSSQGTCTSECASDADCTSGGTCVRSAGGYFLNTTTRGYCFRPCMAGGCSVTGFGCATARRLSDGRDASVCVPQQWITADSLAACASPSRARFRECGLINRVGYACTPGSPLTFGCVAGSAGAGCGMLGTCTGNPFIRVCPGDTPCGSWGAIAHADDECGMCPLSTVTCPPAGRVRILAGSLDTAMPFTCFVQRR